MSNETPDEAAIRLKCDAPRVSQADMEANIVHEEILKHVTHSGGDPSAAASKENDRAELGEKYARENAVRKLSSLMAYALKEKQT